MLFVFSTCALLGLIYLFVRHTRMGTPGQQTSGGFSLEGNGQRGRHPSQRATGDITQFWTELDDLQFRRLVDREKE